MYSCSWFLLVTSVVLLLLPWQLIATDAGNATIKDPQALANTSSNFIAAGSSPVDERKTVKKALPPDMPPSEKIDENMHHQAEVVVSERRGPPTSQKPAVMANHNQSAQHQQHPKEEQKQSSSSNLPIDDVHIEHSNMNLIDDSFSEANNGVFYILVGITSSAILLFILRVYRMRLTRAERKYGVQGDRANQELTPLPMAIEDVNSDEEDHTVFEVNRQNIRIL